MEHPSPSELERPAKDPSSSGGFQQGGKQAWKVPRPHPHISQSLAAFTCQSFLKKVFHCSSDLA